MLRKTGDATLTFFLTLLEHSGSISNLTRRTTMTDDELKTLRSLHEQGYAIAIFTPEELEGVTAATVEDLMVERGWDAIHDLKDGQ